MAVQQAFIGEVTVALDYKASTESKTIRETIPPECISFVLIDYHYENIRILPVIYITMNIDNTIYSHVVNSVETSQFYLRIRKKNGLSKTAAWSDVVNDQFSYVCSNSNANYSQTFNPSGVAGISYTRVTVGLVSIKMTNLLRKSFNGIYNNITTKELINLAMKDLPNVVMQELDHDKSYDTILIPPCSSVFRYLNYLFYKDAYYDSLFTLFMDFNKTYLLSKNGKYVDSKDSSPSNVIINIKDYTVADAMNEGFTVENGAYVINVNASYTNIIINTATEKVSNRYIAYSDEDESGIQILNTRINQTEGITDKTSFVRTKNAAALKNELQTNAITIEITKPNIDTDIFVPNRTFSVKNYKDYNKYDGSYILSNKKDCYYQNSDGSFSLQSSFTLKKTFDEEIATTSTDTSLPQTSSNFSKTSSTSRLLSTTKSVVASRRKDE